MGEREDFEHADHVATLEVRKTTSGGMVAWIAIGEEEGSWQQVPEHLASQLPMALHMMKAQIGS